MNSNNSVNVRKYVRERDLKKVVMVVRGTPVVQGAPRYSTVTHRMYQPGNRWLSGWRTLLRSTFASVLEERERERGLPGDQPESVSIRLYSITPPSCANGDSGLEPVLSELERSGWIDRAVAFRISYENVGTNRVEDESAFVTLVYPDHGPGSG